MDLVASTVIEACHWSRTLETPQYPLLAPALTRRAPRRAGWPRRRAAALRAGNFDGPLDRGNGAPPCPRPARLPAQFGIGRDARPWRRPGLRGPTVFATRASLEHADVSTRLLARAADFGCATYPSRQVRFGLHRVWSFRAVLRGQREVTTRRGHSSDGRGKAEPS